MNRTTAQNWILLLGALAWWIGHLGLRTFELASWPALVAELVATVGLAVVVAVVVIGVWHALRIR